MRKQFTKPDFSKAFKIFLSFSTLTAATVGITLISLKNRDKNELIDKKSSINHSSETSYPILKEINYLALGDSITAGFNWDYSFDFRGNINKMQVKGLSYAAFFADFVQKINPNAIKSFDNLALSWTTITDWLYLLEPENREYQNFDKTHLNFNYELDKLTKSPYGEQIRNVFGNFSAKNYQKLQEKIKNANLLTLSLGANDLLESIDFRIITKPSQKIATKSQAAFEFIQNTNLAIEKINKNLNIFIQKIKKINPNLQIVLVGYNILFSHTMKFFDHLLVNELGLPKNYTTLVLKQLNETIKHVARKQRINFVDLYNEKSWKDKSNKFSKNEFDIHPSTKGYKKMAQDLLFKLAFKQNLNFKNEFVKKLNWNQEYLEKDLNAYRQILNLGSNLKIFNALSTDNSVDKFIAEQSAIEKISSDEITKIKDSKLIILLRTWYEIGFGTFLEKFLRSNTQINEKLREMLSDFLLKNAKNNQSFSTVFHKILQSDFFSEIITRLQNYINNVITNQNFEKATISELVDSLFNNFSEKKIINLLKDVLNSDFASQNAAKIKELLFVSVFGQSAIQDFLINTIIEIAPEYKDDLKVVFSFESTRKLFSYIINDFVLESKKYINVNNFYDILKIFLANSQNYENIQKFSCDFISESLKHRESVRILVKTLNSNYNFNLSEVDKNSLISLLLSVSDMLIRTKTWNTLNKQVAKSFLDSIKNRNFRNNDDKISKFFTNQIQTSYSTFFKKPQNLLNLFHELLTFELSNNQITVLKKVINKFYQIITRFELTDFIDQNTPNYNNFSIFFNSIKDFLSANSFKVLNNIVSEAINDFVVNKFSYQKIDNLNRFGFQFLANNLPKLEENIYDYIAKTISNNKFFSNLFDLISKSLRSEGFSQKSVQTFSEILQVIFEDFSKKYQQLKLDKNNKNENLIFEFVQTALESFKNFTNSNFREYNELKDNLEKLEKYGNEDKIQLYKSKIENLDANLTLGNFSNFFLKNFLKSDIIFRLLKNLAKLDLKSKVGIQNLVLFFKDLFSQTFLQKQIITKLRNNSIFGQENVKNTLLELLFNFFTSNQIEELLEKFVNYIFSNEDFLKASNFTGFISNFINKNSELIEKVFSLFLNESTTWNALSNFLKSILKASKLNISENAIHTIQDLIRDILAQWKKATLTNQSKIKKIESPLVIQALIRIIFDYLTDDLPFGKSIFEILLDSFSVDIANNYYKNVENVINVENKISQNQISNLFFEIAKTDAISEQIREGLQNIPKNYLDSILRIFDAFLKSPSLLELFNSYFKLVAKAEINKPLNNFSLIKTLFEKQYFTKIIGEFLVKLENAPNLKGNFATLVSEIFNVQFQTTEISPFFKLLKEIIQDNLNNYYNVEPNFKDFLPERNSDVDQFKDKSDVKTNLFTGSSSVNSENSSPQTEKNTLKTAIYSKDNALLSKLVTIISKLTNREFSFENFNILLEKELGSQEFIIEFIKQIGTVYNKIHQSEKNLFWDTLVKIFKSDFFAKKILIWKFDDFSHFKVFKKLSQQEKKRINLALKNSLEKFLPNNANKILIFRILDFINKNTEKFKNVKDFPTLLSIFLKEEQSKSSNSKPEVKNNETQDNSTFLKSYLWYLVDFLLRNGEFSNLMVDEISSYLSLNLEDSANFDLKSFKIKEPRQIIKKFLKEFVGMGLKNKLIDETLNQVILSIKSYNSNTNESFFDSFFAKFDLSKMINLDLVINLEEKILSKPTQISKHETEVTEVKIDDSKLTIISPENQKISVESFVDFFDLIFLASPKWDKKKEAEQSPILKELNHIKYTGISFSDLFNSGQKDLQLEAISKLFYKIYSDDINKHNFKDTAKGRVLYRFLLILLFYAYESRVKNSWLRSSAFYGGLFSSSTASEVILKHLKNAKNGNHNGAKTDNYTKFIDELKGEPVKAKGWFSNTWYTNKDVKLNDMLTMIYYNEEQNRFKNQTGQEKLRDQILEQIRQGTYPTNFQDPNPKK